MFSAVFTRALQPIFESGVPLTHLTSADFEFLTSPRGREARQVLLAELLKHGKAAETLTLKWQSKLRSLGYAVDEACGSIEQACLSQLQTQREVFRTAQDYLYLRDALEQCSTWRLAAHRACSLKAMCKTLDLKSDSLVEVGCGIGGDSLELAREFELDVFELDPQRANIARHNLEQLKSSQECSKIRFTVTQGDFLNYDPKLCQGRPLFIDPGRRKLDKAGQMKRIFDPEQYQPPLSRLLNYVGSSPLLCIKVAPGLPDEAVSDLECELEFVSHQRTCKEAVIWAYAGAKGRRATVLDSDGGILEFRQSEVETMTAPEVGLWIHEPDPAILRAHAMGEVANQLGAGLLQREIGYLVGPASGPHPASQSFEILEILPLNQAHIRKACLRHEIGILEIKKRGVPIEPDQYRVGLKLDSKKFRKPGVLILTRYNDERIAFLCQRPISKSH
jgi:hypothetical protein